MFNLVIPDCSEAEATNLASGAPSERIKRVSRQALLRAREDAARAYRYEERSDGAYDVYDGDNLLGTARHYARYWQIYLRSDMRNIRRQTLPALKRAIEGRDDAG